MRNLLILVLVGIFLLGFSGSRGQGFVWAQGFYSSDVDYTTAIPNLLNTTTDKVESLSSEEELNAYAQWQEETRTRIQEFLDDLIQVSINIEDASQPDDITADYQNFAKNWTNIIYSFPGLSELSPEADQLIEGLFDDLPKLRAPESSDTPWQNFREWFSAMQAKNPWGLSSLFHIEPMPDRRRAIDARQTYLETATHGVKTKENLNEYIQLVQDGRLLYRKRTQNGELVEEFIIPRNPTLIHEIVNKARTTSLDPMVIQALEQLVRLIDQELLAAVEEGRLDEDTYAAIYGSDYWVANDFHLDLASWFYSFLESIRQTSLYQYISSRVQSLVAFKDQVF